MTPRRRTPKRAVTYRLPQDILDRIAALADARHWTIATTVELLLDGGLAREGFPRQNGVDDAPEK